MNNHIDPADQVATSIANIYRLHPLVSAKKLSLIMCAAGIFAVVSNSFAASVSISNTPMAVQNTAKSNVMFTMDSSGGMEIEMLLPTFNSMYYENGVTPGNNPGLLNGNFFLFPSKYHDTFGLWLDSMLQGDTSNPDALGWRPRNAHYNPQYYDPFKTYQPWAGSDALGNAFANARPSAIQYDPYGQTTGTVDITQEMDSGSTVNGWTVPQAHTYLDKNGVDITSSGGRYYDSHWFLPVYYVWTDLNNNGIMDIGEGTRYEIKDSLVTCAGTDPSAVIPGCGGVPVVFPSGRTYTSELQNFANWFQYYRTNMLSMQGAVGKQIATLGAARVGMTALYQPSIPSPVADMSVPANAAALQNNIYALIPNLGNWSQPIHERMNNVFNYFTQTGSVNGVPAPIQYACQQNFNILATPGYLNESSSNRFRNPFTGVRPALFPVGDYDSTGTAPGAQTVPYADWSVSGNPSYSDTLADWSLYIYNQNLRADLPSGQVPLVTSAHETNSNPHLDTYVIAPGAVPVLGGAPRNLNPSTADPYSISPSIDWPKPGFVSQSTIDDLWHAAVNGRGMFVNSTDTYGGLSTVLNDIMGRIGAAAAVAVSNANISPGDNFSYASSYNAGNWSGDLQAYPIDLTTGQPSAIGMWLHTARDQIDTLVMTSSRFIATMSNDTGVPFRWSNLTSAQKSMLNSPVTPPGTNDGANVLLFLRGDRSLEGTSYRIRGHVLGDIIDAEPVIVREPMMYYTDNGYAAYKTQYTTTSPRLKMVYQAANDGMVHAFNAANGAELWAYVPALMFNSTMPTYPSTSSLTGLSIKNGFSHLYLVDGTPTNGDVDFGNTAGQPGTSPDWHSILSGGFRRGGRGYYALDVTQPVIATEFDVAAKAMWEFPNAGTSPSVTHNIGFSYGKPLIVKTAAAGWVVIVTSGYNNGTNAGDSGGDGLGHLFVLNAKTGALIKDISTSAGTPSSPSNLGQISGWVDNGSVDNTVKQVYGTDLSGNVWRFDLSAKTLSGWTVNLLAGLVDASGMPQPISTSPELAGVNGKHMVYVGTGQYLSTADVSTTQVQSIYALIDDLSSPSAGPVILPLRSQLLKQTFTASGSTQTTGINLSLSSAQKGWYADLPIPGERIVTDPAIANSTIVFTTDVPSSSDPCHPGGSSWLYALNYVNGNQVAGSTWAGMSLGNALASRPILVQMPDGTIKALVRKSDATTASTSIPVTGGSDTGHRVSWREITR